MSGIAFTVSAIFFCIMAGCGILISIIGLIVIGDIVIRCCARLRSKRKTARLEKLARELQIERILGTGDAQVLAKLEKLRRKVAKREGVIAKLWKKALGNSVDSEWEKESQHEW